MTVELDDSYESLFNRIFNLVTLEDLPGAAELAWRIMSRLRKLSSETLTRRPEYCDMLLMAYALWAELERWQGYGEHAIAVSEQFLVEHPELDEINLWIGRLRVEHGQIEEGVTVLREAAERLNSTHGWNVLGIQLAELGQADRAENCHRKAIACATNNEDAVSAYRYLIELYKTQRRVTDMLDAWNTILVLMPEMAEEASELYRWLIDHKEIKHAQSLLQRERDRSVQTFYNGLIAWRSGQAERARRLWQDVFQAQRSPLAEWMEAALRLGHWAEVVDEFVNSDDVADYSSILAMVGLACALGGDLELMHKYLQKAIFLLKRHWPARHKISGRWPLVTDLVSDSRLLSVLDEYFEQSE